MEKIAQLDAVVWGISPESKATQSRWVERTGIGLPLLSDEGSAVIKKYGILNEEHGAVPHPATVVVGKDGKIRYFKVDRDYTRRPPLNEILSALRPAD